MVECVHTVYTARKKRSLIGKQMKNSTVLRIVENETVQLFIKLADEIARDRDSVTSYSLAGDVGVLIQENEKEDKNC